MKKCRMASFASNCCPGIDGVNAYTEAGGINQREFKWQVIRVHEERGLTCIAGSMRAQ